MVACKFKRSHAIRVKIKNLNNSVPQPIREFILGMYSSSSCRAGQKQIAGGLEDEENLTLVEQIRRGVKLNPVSSRLERGEIAHTLEAREKSVYELLVETLAKRNSAMQLSSDEDDSNAASDEDELGEEPGHEGLTSGRNHSSSCVVSRRVYELVSS